MNIIKSDRRQFLASLGAAGLFFATRGLFAEALTLTPEQTIGPYYPDRLPLDLDNDLLVINDAITPAIGTISWVHGRVLTSSGSPVRGALVEIWQADNNGAYIHSASPITNRDRNFQGYGKFLTGSSGEYLFRTVKPGLYPGRTRHIHYKITMPNNNSITTQLYVLGETLNNNDGVLNGIRDTTQRNSVIKAWTPIVGSAVGECDVNFDIVLNYTPTDNASVTKPTLVSMYSVVNGASFYPGVASGSWITVFGNGLSKTTRTWTNEDIVNNKLPEKLDNVSVLVNNKPADVYYVSPTQLNVLAPTDSSTGQVQVSVSNENGVSSSVSVDMAPFQPAFFNSSDEYVSAVRPDGSYVGPDSPAKSGETLLLYGTGFGPTNPTVAAGEVMQAPAALANAVKVQIDNTLAQVDYAGLISPGLYQFNIVVPQVQNGDHAVTAEVGGIRTLKIAKLKVSS